jgi:hypothetical protein
MPVPLGSKEILVLAATARTLLLSVARFPKTARPTTPDVIFLAMIYFLEFYTVDVSIP